MSGDWAIPGIQNFHQIIKGHENLIKYKIQGQTTENQKHWAPCSHTEMIPNKLDQGIGGVEREKLFFFSQEARTEETS